MRPRPRRAFRALFDRLEPRIALSTIAIAGDTLTITGTPGADRILIEATSRKEFVRVVLDGKDAGRFGPVASIAVDAGAGDDVVVVGPHVTQQAVIDGGPGNDTLRRWRPDPGLRRRRQRYTHRRQQSRSSSGAGRGAIA